MHHGRVIDNQQVPFLQKNRLFLFFTDAHQLLVDMPGIRTLEPSGIQGFGSDDEDVSAQLAALLAQQKFITATGCHSLSFRGHICDRAPHLFCVGRVYINFKRPFQSNQNYTRGLHHDQT